jgi:hypothetical protein
VACAAKSKMRTAYASHSPRRSHDTNRSASSDGTEPRRRSISDIASTPRQLTAGPALRSLSSSTSAGQLPADQCSISGATKRLGFLAEKLSSSAQLLPHLHTHHSRVDSSHSSSTIPAISAPMSSTSKPHVSPAKVGTPPVLTVPRVC